MPTYLVNWNPKRWHWEDHAKFVAKTLAGEMPVFDWSTGNRKSIETGDRLFLVRQSTQRGIIGSGHAVRKSYEAPHWDESREDMANVVDVRWDAILDPADVLPVAELEAANLGVPWDNLMGSGVQVPDESTERLEQLWEAHLRSLGRIGGTQTPMIFLRTGWMKHYRGVTKDDPISGGGKYVEENRFGHEMYNFLPFKGRVYGYCRNTPGGKSEYVHGAGIKIEKLGAGKRDRQLDGVLVVWLAKRPQGGTEIVGWYRNATVYRDWQEPPQGSNRVFNGEAFGYHVSATEGDATLLPPEKRTFVIPPRGPGIIGQANVWYADDPATASIRQQVLRYVQGYGLPVYPDELDESRTYSEGAKRQVIINAYERDSRARAACIKFYGTKCVVCGFDFGEFYGELGEGFIHVHHLRDLATVGEGYKVDPIKDLRPVCPNCHAMLHQETPAMGIESLQLIIKRERRK
jgi:5-methylcytosine-specific restriction protein A